jgi:serine/threonine protein kinase
MPAEAGSRAEQIFLHAITLSERERSRYVIESCNGDDRLRRDVEELLHYDSLGGDGIEAAIGSVAASMASDAPSDDDWIGSTLGSYQITEKLGEGGMGTVFAGERADSRFQKRVAIKLVSFGMGQRGRERFFEERRILARLDHPNIARLLDGGETDQGVPYLVMEFVDGVPISTYCEQQASSKRRICELMIEVCQGVAYAHQNLVIHRDLKPANILVDASGTPKLLDFGIAGLLGDQASVRAFTPEYASPELTLGEPVDTTADVFSLGIILRRLLGSKTDPELESIVKKATAAKPQDRYATAAQLAAELRDYLNGYPVKTFRGGWFYQASKFAQRNRAAVLISSFAAVSLIAATAVATVQATRADAARVDAQRRLDDLISIANRTVTSIDTTLERIPGATEGRRKIVEETVAFLDRARSSAADNPELLRTVGRGYLRMGLVLGAANRPNLGRVEEAKRHLDNAEQIFLSLLERNPGSEEAQLDWIKARFELGLWMENNRTVKDAVEVHQGALQRLERQGVPRSKELILYLATTHTELLTTCRSWICRRARDTPISRSLCWNNSTGQIRKTTT